MEGVARRLVRILLSAGLVVVAVAVSAADARFLLEMMRQYNPTVPVHTDLADLTGKAAFMGLLCWTMTLPGFLVLWVLGRRAGVRASSLVIVAAVAAILNGINGGRLQGLAFPPYSLVGSFDWDLALLTPVVEEMVKLLAVALVMLASGARTARAGIVLGAAAGLGMTAWETAHFIILGYLLETTTWFGVVIALRFPFLGLGLHATVTALAGLGLGEWMERGRRPRDVWMPVAGLLGAVALHGTWNVAAESLMGWVFGLVHPPGQEQGGIDTFAAASVVTMLMLAVPWAILAVAWRRSGHRCRDAAGDAGPESAPLRGGPESAPVRDVSPSDPPPASA